MNTAPQLTIDSASRELSENLARPAKSILDYAHGLHLDVPEDVYFERRVDVVHKHRLDLVLQAPALLKSAMEGPEIAPTKAMAFGTAFHMALLEPIRFREAYSGRLSADDRATIECMVDSVRAEIDGALAPRMLEQGVPEVTCRWKDPATGLECVCKADLWIEELAMLVDVKTTSDGSWDGFRYSCEKYAYHRQDAFYREGFRQLGHTIGAFVFMVVEKNPPHLVSFYEIDPIDVEAGMRSCRKGMETLAECIRTGVWGGYPQRIQTVKLRSWAT